MRYEKERRDDGIKLMTELQTNSELGTCVFKTRQDVASSLFFPNLLALGRNNIYIHTTLYTRVSAQYNRQVRVVRFFLTPGNHYCQI